MFSQKTITGNVSDENGPLPGANIIELGTNNGVSTDFDGNFEITVEGNSSIIEVSYTGFKSQTFEVGSLSTFSLLLEESAEELQEVIVTSLGFVEIRDQQGSTSSIVKPEDITNDEALFGDGLGLDSIDALELGIALQQKYGIKIIEGDEENRKHFFSVNSISEFVKNQISNK